MHPFIHSFNITCPSPNGLWVGWNKCFKIKIQYIKSKQSGIILNSQIKQQQGKRIQNGRSKSQCTFLLSRGLDKRICLHLPRKRQQCYSIMLPQGKPFYKHCITTERNSLHDPAMQGVGLNDSLGPFLLYNSIILSLPELKHEIRTPGLVGWLVSWLFGQSSLLWPVAIPRMATYHITGLQS